MHFTGRTWRPPYEAYTPIIQITSGCSYNKCKFCSLYKHESFKLAPMEEYEADLEEIKSYQPYARRIFWTGANPFTLGYEQLKLRALLVRDYLIKCRSIAMFASIRDIKSKNVKQLRRLKALGIDGLSIGTESGDDRTLKLVNKGYTAKDIIEQCQKLDIAGIEYYFVYMTGLAGKGNGLRNATRSAEVFSKLNPRFISIDSLTLFPDTELFKMTMDGEFTPAGEKERIEELINFIKNLQIKTHLMANTISNYYPVSGFLPKDKNKIISELEYILETVSEETMQEYRENLNSLG